MAPQGTAIAPLADEDTDYVTDLARAFYLHFCAIRSYNVQPPPYCPAWALDYARIAIRFQQAEGAYKSMAE